MSRAPGRRIDSAARLAAWMGGRSLTHSTWDQTAAAGGPGSYIVPSGG